MPDVPLDAVRVVAGGSETALSSISAASPARGALELLSQGGVSAHRGASGHWPENTMAAYRSATWWGVDALEVDIALTSDGVVVCHSGTSTQPTVGRAGDVRSMTWAELSEWSVSAKGTDRPYQPRGAFTRLSDVVAELGDRVLIVTPSHGEVEAPAVGVLSSVASRVVWRAATAPAGFAHCTVGGGTGDVVSLDSSAADEVVAPVARAARRAGRPVIMGPLSTNKDVLRARAFGATMLSMKHLRGVVTHKAARPALDPKWWDGFVFGTTEPTAENTGLVAPLKVRRPGERIYADTPGEVFRDMEIGEIVVRAPGVRIHNCLFTGVPGITTSRGMVDATNLNCSDLVVTHCEFDNSRVEASWWYTAIMGHDFWVIRCHMHDVNDGVGIFNSRNATAWTNCVVLGCYIHDLAYWSPSPTHSDNRTHNDCIQHQGGGKDLIVGNKLIANPSTKVGNGTEITANPYANVGPQGSVTGQAIGITPNVRDAQQILIMGNWLNYGAQSLTIVENKFPFVNPVGYIAGNRFGGNNPELTRDGVKVARPVVILPTIPTVGLPSTTGPDLAHENTTFTGEPVTVYRTSA